MKPFGKAVFPVADFCTYFLLVIKSMPKELLPIDGKPLIQYAAEEAVTAGIDTLIFVVGRKERAIENHCGRDQEVEAALRAECKNEQAQMVRSILLNGIECVFVPQLEVLGRRHAVLCGERAVGTDPSAVLFADDFLSLGGAGVITDWVKRYEATELTQL